MDCKIAWFTGINGNKAAYLEIRTILLNVNHDFVKWAAKSGIIEIEHMTQEKGVYNT